MEEENGGYTRMIFPFSAIVSQEELKTALMLNVISPSIGGLLIMGEKGTAKSTAVRALADLLPEIDTVAGCPFNCDPGGVLCTECQDRRAGGHELVAAKRKMRVIELPLGITEDRLVGNLDLEHALKRGEKRFEPGILADANRNFLYVDEVNLLDDHIVDLLLDSAAMGINTVEREGISFMHPARFVLVGTMNPEEGDLRPQLLDRFGLCVVVSSLHNKSDRVQILRRRAQFDADPAKFSLEWMAQQQDIATRINAGRARLSDLPVEDALLEKIVTVTESLNLDGHRADIVMLKAAQALAAFRHHSQIDTEDVDDVALLALHHRLRRLPFQEVGADRDKIAAALGKG